MSESDTEQEKVIELPEYKLRYKDMDLKLANEIILCKKQFSYLKCQIEAGEVFKQFKNVLDKDLATKLINRVEKNPIFNLGEGAWQCIVGKNFGSSLTFEAHLILMFDLLEYQKTILVFKSG